MYAIPAWLQIWAHDSQIVDFLAKLDFVVRHILPEAFSKVVNPFTRLTLVDLYQLKLVIV